MNDQLKGKAVLVNMDGYIEMECEMNRFGKLFWNVETCYLPGDGAVLAFEFESDQTYLLSLIKQLTTVLTAFPVIGKP